MWNPPLIDEALGTRRSALAEAAELLARLVATGARAICFIKSRKGVELLEPAGRARSCAQPIPSSPSWSRPTAPATPPRSAARSRRAWSRGELRAVVTTDALELGIDIGALDAASSSPSPARSRACARCGAAPGGAGAGSRVYVAGEDALDQFFCRHPDEFLERPVEAAILDHESEQIYRAHLLCAAHEGPLSPPTPSSSGRAGRRTPSALVERRASCARRRQPRGATYVLRDSAATPRRGCRCARPRPTLAIVDVSSGELLGTTEAARAPLDAPRGGDLPAPRARLRGPRARPRRRRALVEPFDGDWYTQPKRETDIEIERLLDRREALGVTLSFGEVTVTETVLAYQRRRLADHAPIDLRRARPARDDLLDPGAVVRARRRAPRPNLPLEVLLGALHATEHAQIAVLPLIAMCDRWDIGGLSTNFHPQTGAPTIFIYDGHPGGIGIARRRSPASRSCRRRPPADRRVPVRERLPLLRAVAKVRKPQRAAVQGRRARCCSSGCSPPQAAHRRPIDAAQVVEAQSRSSLEGMRRALDRRRRRRWPRRSRPLAARVASSRRRAGPRSPPLSPKARAGGRADALDAAPDPDDRGLAPAGSAAGSPGARSACPTSSTRRRSRDARARNYNGSVAWYRTSSSAPRAGRLRARLRSANFQATVWVDGTRSPPTGARTCRSNRARTSPPARTRSSSASIGATPRERRGLSPHLVQLRRHRRRGPRPPGRRERAARPDDPDDAPPDRRTPARDVTSACGSTTTGHPPAPADGTLVARRADVALSFPASPIAPGRPR